MKFFSIAANERWRAGELSAKLDAGRSLLSDIADSGVSFDDPRLGYVEVQIDRDTWDALSAYRRRA